MDGGLKILGREFMKRVLQLLLFAQLNKRYVQATIQQCGKSLPNLNLYNLEINPFSVFNRRI
jgi:hypothetical protein